MGIAAMRHRFAEKADRFVDSRFMSARTFQLICAFCGIPCSLLFLLGFVAADFLAPVKPWWGAEQTAHHYQVHKTGVRAGAALIGLSAVFYMPFCTAISAQMRRIPNLHHSARQLQLSAASAGLWTFMLPGIILATTSYRPWRDVNITQSLNDFFWICTLMPWPTFMVQSWVLAYAILVDRRAKPLFPKEVAIYNLIIPCLWTPAIGIHCTKHGAVAYNGGLTFWCLGVTFCTQLFVESVFLMRAIYYQPEGGEQLVDMFPTHNEKDLEANGKDLEAHGPSDPDSEPSSTGALHQQA
ncbi:MAG: hypothetical protein M1819_001957 [Sarea resinae]|nr:MAG: hypothetical protein M1819_001957 [Sarea resinae]